MALSTAQLRQAWAPACTIPGKTIELVQGVKVHVHELAAAAFGASCIEAIAAPRRIASFSDTSPFTSA